MIHISDTSGKFLEVEKEITLGDVYNSFYPGIDKSIVLGSINNEVVDFHTTITKDSQINWITLDSNEGQRAYQRTLIFLMVRAAKLLCNDSHVRVLHSLGKALYCEWIFDDHRVLTVKDVNRLQEKMKEIQASDAGIEKMKASRADTIEYLKQTGEEGNAELLEQLEPVVITYYRSGQMWDYFFGPMLSSFDSLKAYELQHYAPGFLIHYPGQKKPYVIEEYEEIPKFAKVFLEAKEWGRILNCSYVNQLNRYIRDGRIEEIIELAEGLQEKKQAFIADYIVSQNPMIKIVLIAGPSSAGKTTFTKRLCTQLRINDKKPLMISLDDYFYPWDQRPKLDDGTYDFETIQALDIELFNQNITDLYEGKSVNLPEFNFTHGTRTFREKDVCLDRNGIVVVEGLHALNDELSRIVPRYEKYKIYLGALTQLAINDHNRISTSDTRLIRRLVRDFKFRNHPAEKTFTMWRDVRRGEETNIFPFQEDADVIFNSALIYELSVLKKEAMPLLEEIRQDSQFYSLAQHLIRFLSPFIELDSNVVPTRSILREFVGKD